MSDDEVIQLERMADRSVRITIIAEACDECGERVRYWNDPPDVGNVACGCTDEGPETCDPIVMRPRVTAMLADALRPLGVKCVLARFGECSVQRATRHVPDPSK